MYDRLSKRDRVAIALPWIISFSILGLIYLYVMAHTVRLILYALGG